MEGSDPVSGDAPSSSDESVIFTTRDTGSLGWPGYVFLAFIAGTCALVLLAPPWSYVVTAASAVGVLALASWLRKDVQTTVVTDTALVITDANGTRRYDFASLHDAEFAWVPYSGSRAVLIWRDGRRLELPVTYRNRELRRAIGRAVVRSRPGRVLNDPRPRRALARAGLDRA